MADKAKNLPMTEGFERDKREPLGTEQPGMEQPGMEQPRMRQPGMEQPRMRQPRMEQSRMWRHRTGIQIRVEPWIPYPAADACFTLLDTVFLERPMSMDDFDNSYTDLEFQDYDEEESSIQRRQGMLLKGSTNSGKTRILRKFKKRIEQDRGGEITVGDYKQKISLHPIIYISTPPLKMLFMFKDILKQLNAPCPVRTSQDELLGKVIESLIESEVRMLILDEFQNVLEGEKGNLPLLMRILVHISNKAGMSLVLAGTPEIDVAISKHDPLRNRLLLFKTSIWSKGKDFQDFLFAMGASHNIICEPHLYSPKMAKKIFNMTEGIIGEVSNVLFRLSALSDNGFINEEIFSKLEKNWIIPSKRKKI